MTPKRGIRRLFRFPTRTNADIRVEADDELAFHVEMRTEALVGEGLSGEEARARALRELGDPRRAAASLIRHDLRSERARLWTRAWSDLRQDAAYAVRVLSKNRGFAIAAILTIAVAIGGNTAMFSVINALFLQPLAVSAPDAIVRVHTGESTASWPTLDDIRARNRVFSGVIAQATAHISMAAEPLPVRLAVGLVSDDYFTVLGAVPLRGRTLQPGDRDVMVIGERLWQSRFNADEAIVGSTIAVDGRPRQIVGVMPRSFRGIAPPGFARDAWIPVEPSGAHRGLATDRAATRFEIYARLLPGTSAVEAQAAMRVLGAQMAAEHPATNQHFGALEVFTASGIGLYRGAAKALAPVFAFVGFLTTVALFILLVSCANLAGLLLGRAAARRHEIAIRLAIGAGRFRVVRQLLTEAIVIALSGGAAGLALAVALTRGLSYWSTQLPASIDLQVALDGRVFVYAVALSLASALLFGLAPARRAARADVVDALKADGSGGPTAHQRFRQMLVVAQVAVSALLLFWSGLFARSLAHAQDTELGFDPSGVLLAEVQLTDDGPDARARADAAFVALHERARALPGVQEVGWSTIVPLALTGNERFDIRRAEDAEDGAGTRVTASRLSPGWFTAVRIPIVAGRDFTWQDRDGAPRVVIVNQTLARMFWSGSPLGQRIRMGSDTADIVGVVRDSKYWTLGEDITPTVYLPFRQQPASHPLTLHIRTADPRATGAAVRSLAQEIAAGPAELKAMQDAVGAATIPARVGAVATAAFGLIGALLATIGVYGLISYIVVQRSREMAIRRAIGAPTAHIVRVVVGRSAALAGGGLAVGLAFGALAAPALGGLLVNVSPRDPLTMTMAAGVVMGTAIAASVPAVIRAVRVDPRGVVRGE